MEHEPDCLSPQHVKARLQEIIEAIKDGKDIDVPESEIRELQHFFNERSMVFLQTARHELRQRDAARRLQGIKRGIHYDKKIICYQLNCKKNKDYYCTETDRTKCKLLQ
jgi:hypothetical protein